MYRDNSYKHFLIRFFTIVLVLMASINVSARVIDIDEAIQITRKLREGQITRETYDVEGVVRGTCNARQDSLLLNADIWQGDKMLFAFRLSDLDSTAFNHRYSLRRGDTVVIRTRLEDYRGVACSYYGYLVNVRRYVNPINDLVRDSKDHEWQLLIEEQRNESETILLWIVVVLSLLILCVLMAWLRSVSFYLRHDSLTNFYNRQSGQTAIKHKMWFSIKGYFCLLDIDHYKVINDTYGHHIGDECLVQFSTLIREHFKGSTAIRMEGDVFAVYVEDVDREDLRLLMEDFFGRVQDIRLSADADYQISVSIGTAYYDGTGTFDQLYQRADRGLFESKLHDGSWLT